MKLFPKLSSLHYKMFNAWKLKQYMKFLRKENYDFDWGSIIDMNILKLTMMGLQFAKFGVIVDEDRKKQVRTIWAARRELKNCRDAFDIVWVQAQRKFKEKYGFEFESTFTWKALPNGMSQLEEAVPITPEPVSDEKAKEMSAYWDSLFDLSDEWKLEKASLKKAFKIIAKHIFSWWD